MAIRQKENKKIVNVQGVVHNYNLWKNKWKLKNFNLKLIRTKKDTLIYTSNRYFNYSLYSNLPLIKRKKKFKFLLKEKSLRLNLLKKNYHYKKKRKYIHWSIKLARRFQLKKKLLVKIQKQVKGLVFFNKKKSNYFTFKKTKHLKRIFLQSYNSLAIKKNLLTQTPFYKLRNIRYSTRKQGWRRKYRKLFKHSFFRLSNKAIFKKKLLKLKNNWIKKSIYNFPIINAQKNKNYKIFQKFIKKQFKWSRIRGLFYRNFNLLGYFKKFLWNKHAYWKTQFITKNINLKKKPIDFLNKFIFFSLINHFSNCLLQKGYKKKSLNLLLNLFLISKFKLKTNLISIFIKGLRNIKPLFYFKVMYIGGKKYNIPIMQAEQKCLKLGVRWLTIQSTDKQQSTKLDQLVLASKNEGPLVKKRKEHHLNVYENKSYTRFLRFLKSF